MWVIWLLGGLALILGVSSDKSAILSEPYSSLIDVREANWYLGEFRPGGIYPSTDSTTLPSDKIRTIGSWIGGDQWQGTAETPWSPAPADSVQVYIAGYPSHPGCKVWAEFKSPEGDDLKVECHILDPGEVWVPWNIPVPKKVTSMRILAMDSTSEFQGWVAFSEPVSLPLPSIATTIRMGVRILTTFALSVTLICLPGILLSRGKITNAQQASRLLGAGPGLLIVIGLLVWLCGGIYSTRSIAWILVTGSWIGIGLLLKRRPPALDERWGSVYIVSILIALTAVLKASYSTDAQGELYRGTLSRTLAVGDRSDARIPFHVVQTAAWHFNPTSPEADRYFAPWTFFSRGPLAGLAALPVSLATAGMPPQEMPNHAWKPFDSTGYAAYRIVLITLASMVIVALFVTLVPFTGEKWAAIGAGLLALSPFGVHEIMFTWPKWESTACILLSFLFAHQRRAIGSGLSLAVGFLFHPLALLWIPWIAIWLGGRCWSDSSSSTMRHIKALGSFFLSLGSIVLTWMIIGQLAPHSSDATAAGQLSFVTYFVSADNAPATWSSWLYSRWLNFSNTFIPFWLQFSIADHGGLRSIYGPTSSIDRFAFLWWNTLPLGMGLALWVISCFAITKMLLRTSLTSIVIVLDNCFAAIKITLRSAMAVGVLLIGPALLLIVYWGASATGLMRECGHPLYVAAIGLTCYQFSRSPGALATFLSQRLFPWLQLPETLSMLWLTTVLNTAAPEHMHAHLDSVYLAGSAATLALAAWYCSNHIRKRSA